MTLNIEQQVENWLNFDGMPAELIADLRAADDIEDRFRTALVFGTGGLRGVLGAGVNRMNIYTVAQATNGLAGWINADCDSREKSCAIAYDSRKNSLLFARTCAQVLASAGIHVHLFPTPTPTPMLSYAVRALGCAAGVVITASHNPARYNGYKAYGPDGCQVTQAAADAIYARMQQRTLLSAPDGDFDALLASGMIRYIAPALEQAFFSAVLGLCINRPSVPVKVAYSALNGTGYAPVSSVLGMLGNVELFSVPEQQEPDENFPTCRYPNPENPAAMALVTQTMLDNGCDLCIATDPDCDRAGVGVIENGAARLLSGNEVGMLLLDYVCMARTRAGTMPDRPLAIKTIVTTPMADAIAAAHGVQIVDVLTGFKYIGEQISALADAGEAERFIFGFEESCGYLSGVHVRDKDAVNACALICEAAAYYKSEGRTLPEVLNALYVQHGFYRSALLDCELAGADGATRIGEIMQKLRNDPAAAFPGRAISGVVDYLCGTDGLPSSDVLALQFADKSRMTIRPSGTEPKIKAYLFVAGATIADAQQRLEALSEACQAVISC